jgi:RimJ/RimL family protein N-acetyltransferase
MGDNVGMDLSAGSDVTADTADSDTAGRVQSADFVPVLDARPSDIVWPAMAWPPRADTVLGGRVVEVTPLDLDRDGESVFHALDEDRVWHHIPFRPADPDTFAALMRKRIASGLFPWVVRLATAYRDLPAGAVLGMSSFLDVAVADARLEIGATIYRPSVWGTAVNPETKLLLLGFAIDELHVGRVQLKTDVRNTRSQRAIAYMGARYEGTLGRYQRRADGTVRDSVLFSVLAEDWPRVRLGLQRRLDGVTTGVGEPG